MMVLPLWIVTVPFKAQQFMNLLLKSIWNIKNIISDLQYHNMIYRIDSNSVCAHLR